MSQDSFFERWSARKRAAMRTRDAVADVDGLQVEPATEAESQIRPASAAEEAADPAETPITEEELARLPPVETATREELRAFLRKGVPGTLKRAALRRVWMLNPRIRDYVDPALDYAWDFNKVAGDAGPLGSADAARFLKTMVLGEKAAPSNRPAGSSVEAAPPLGKAPDPTAAELAAADRTTTAERTGEPEGARDVDAAPEAIEVDAAAPDRPRRHGSATPRLS